MCETLSTGFLGAITATALSVFRGPRYLALGSHTATPAYGRTGILGGDTFATRFVKAHRLASSGPFASSSAPWRVVIVADDFGIAATGTRMGLFERVPTVCSMLAKLVARDDGCTLAHEKEATVGSHRRLVHRAAQVLRAKRVSVGRPVVGAPYRGVDVDVGKRFAAMRGRTTEGVWRLSSSRV